MKKIFLISFIFSAVAFSQTLIPKLPQITASSFLLIDAETNKIIAQQNPEASTGLASITKIMTSYIVCLLYTSPSPRDLSTSRMPSSA